MSEPFKTIDEIRDFCDEFAGAIQDRPKVLAVGDVMRWSVPLIEAAAADVDGTVRVRVTDIAVESDGCKVVRMERAEARPGEGRRPVGKTNPGNAVSAHQVQDVSGQVFRSED